MNNNTTQIAIESAREDFEENSGIKTLSSGLKVKLHPVALKVLQEAIVKIKDPDPPMMHNPDKGREEPNPFDPVYKQTLQDNEQKRFDLIADILMIQGVEVLGGIPDKDTWLPRLQFLAKRGAIDLPEDIDYDSDMELSYVYLKYIVADASDFQMLTQHYGISEEDIASAKATFPDNT